MFTLRLLGRSKIVLFALFDVAEYFLNLFIGLEIYLVDDTIK